MDQNLVTEPRGQRSSAKLLTRDEAFLIAVNVAEAVKRAAADIEGHFAAAKFSQPGRLKGVL